MVVLSLTEREVWRMYLIRIGAIFKDQKLSFTETNQLMGFFKLIQGHLEAATSADGADSNKSKSILEQDLESPSVEFLSKMGLSPKLKSYRSNNLSLSASGSYNGVCLASEQELFSHKLILAPSFVIQSPSRHSSPYARDFGSRNTIEKLARSIRISKHSLKLDVANCLAFFPPRSICEDNFPGKKLLHAAINVLFHVPISGSSGKNDSAEDQSEIGDAKPTLLWSVLYTQELAKVILMILAINAAVGVITETNADKALEVKGVIEF